MNLFGQLAGSTGNVFDQAAAWFQNPSIDILYKTFAVIGALLALYFIPATKTYAIWAAGILVFLLLLGSQANPTNAAPASSTLPLPTQIGTPVPASGSAGSTSSSSGSSGVTPVSLLEDAAAILPFLAFL